MKRKIIISNKEFTMPKMSIDTYTEYLDIAEQIDTHPRYTKQDIEIMAMFVCKAYGDQFTVEELKNPETGLDAAGLILEFQFIDAGIGEELTKRMEKIEKIFRMASDTGNRGHLQREKIFYQLHNSGAVQKICQSHGEKQHGKDFRSDVF